MLGFVFYFQVLFSFGLSLDGFEKNCLQTTNQLRRRHGVPDLTWSESLAADARAWANSLAKTNKFEHDYNGMQGKNQGENLAYFKPYKDKCQGTKREDCVECRAIIDNWYGEVKNYDFGMGKSKSPGGVVMHFTQEVWKNSHQFGIGTARSMKYGFILVARYSPRGNRGGPAIFKDNVFPPGTKFDPPPSTVPSSVPPTSEPPTPSAVPSSVPPTRGPPTPSAVPSSAPLTGGPPTPTTSSFPATTNISIDITINNATGPTSTPTSAPSTGTKFEPAPSTVPSSAPPTSGPPTPSAVPSSVPPTSGPPTPSAVPSSAPPTRGPPTPTTSSLPATTNVSIDITINNATGPTSTPTSAPSTGPSKADKSKCHYFVVNSTTYTYAIVQKCDGKPNVTFIPQGEVTTTGKPNFPAFPTVPTPKRPAEIPGKTVTQPTPPPNPCQLNPCKNGGTCNPEGQNFTCTCPDGYWGPICEHRGPTPEEIKDALMLTNMYRAMHQAPELTWSQEMATKAQDWADKLAKEQRLAHEDEKSTDYGENLAEVGSEDKALLRAIDAWYNEATLYNFQDPKFSKEIGHFSQLVWGATNEIGMAKAKTKDQSNVYVVGRYKPAGNVVDQFESNVKPKQ